MARAARRPSICSSCSPRAPAQQKTRRLTSTGCITAAETPALCPAAPARPGHQRSSANRKDIMAATSTKAGRRWLTIAGIGMVTAAAVGLLIVVLPHQQSARAATPAPLPITAAAGAPVTLTDLARTALTDTTAAAGTVDHLITERWDLHSAVADGDVTSVMFPSRRESWRASDGRARTIDLSLTPDASAADIHTFVDPDTPTGSPVRNDYPAGTFPAAFAGRPPTDPAELAGWLARNSARDDAVIVGVTDLLLERTLTGRERAAVLTVLDGHTTLTYAGTSTDRAGRPGVAFTAASTASGGESLNVFLIDPATGRFLASEQISTGGAPALKLTYPAVLSYRTYRLADTVAAIP
ncbi:CU044_5270 family protein [Actinoplanes philippinensis]|uniref:CU044_5270 family protein n=1 Tax=Actinoplanes philippinensis TaxID=35752 RepID=UPI0033FB14E6